MSLQPSCPLCKEARRPSRHFLSKCTYLPSDDRKYLARARRISDVCDSADPELSDVEEADVRTCIADNSDAPPLVNRVQVRQSPYLDAFHNHNSVRITIDSGATGNMIRASTVQYLGLKYSNSSQLAHQADGLSPLKVIGEIRVSFMCGNHKLHFEGLVVENLDVDVLAGMPFMEVNDIAIRPSKREICIGGSSVYRYGQFVSDSSRHAIRRAQILRAPPTKTTVWPGDYLELSLPEGMSQVDDVFALEPRVDLSRSPCDWPAPCFVSSVQGKIRIPNLSSEPQTVLRSEHLCQIRHTYVTETLTPFEDVPPLQEQAQKPPTAVHSSTVQVDPSGMLPKSVVSEIHDVLHEFDDVFNPRFGGYNGAVGPFQAEVNMGPVQPPQRRGRLPQYSRGQMEELQHKFDELEGIGVFKRPEDVGVAVEYVNPSFLVKKPTGGFRLVTAFADVGRYAKPQPSVMPDVDSTLRQIGQWRYLITSDLTKAFHQIPLSKASMKYCGVVTPFRGIRVYNRCAMGMPGSETALEELLCRVLGDLILQGSVVKLADDLYCGGNTPEELVTNWRALLSALRHSGLCLSASKTVIAPKEASILGWVWCNGSIRPCQHRVSTLATCAPPATIAGLRSFIGAFRVLSRVIKDTASLVGPLEDEVAGKNSKDSVNWTDDLSATFAHAQSTLSSSRTIVLPQPTDQLWIVTDGSMKKHGLGATLYLGRGDKLLLGGFFSAKLRARQMTWLPCEIEALSIAAAVKHFSPYIIQAKQRTCILTDSKPCVQAYEKLCRGEFSASPRVLTFLSTVSRFNTSVRHVSGASILPSDHASRNAVECTEPSCQVCSFVRQCETSVVRTATVQDVIQGSTKLPYTNRPAWLQIQTECSDLRRVHAHLVQGTRPSRRVTNARDVKRYLQVATVAKDGLVVVKHTEPFSATRDRIVVPREVLPGLLTSLHIKLEHPSAYQLKSVCKRYFYALDMDRAIDESTQNCHVCSSLQKSPDFVRPQSTCDPPETIGVSFAADVIRRERQFILVIRESVTSLTVTSLIEDERKETLRDSLIRLCVGLLPLDGPLAVIRTDPAPGFAALRNDPLLSQHRITVEVGRAKNANKNPVAERAVQELEEEILRKEPGCRYVTPLSLAIATATLNSRIRGRGLSAREMWLQRDQFTNTQIPVDDMTLILKQHEARMSNHAYSEAAKSPRGVLPCAPNLSVGDLVYLYDDRNKSSARSRYLVVSLEGEWCNIRKFVGSQLRKTSYRVRQTDCYLVPPSTTYSAIAGDISSDEDTHVPHSSCGDTTPQLPPPPDIPVAISEPPVAAPVDDHDSCEDTAIELPDVTTNQSSPPLRRSTRQRRLPQKFEDFVLD